MPCQKADIKYFFFSAYRMGQNQSFTRLILTWSELPIFLTYLIDHFDLLINNLSVSADSKGFLTSLMWMPVITNTHEYKMA